MSDSNGHENGDSRKLTLDALFADQPFLSATMKAQLLHQKLREQDELQGMDTSVLPSQALIGEVPPRLTLVSDQNESQGDVPQEIQATSVDLQKAAGFLRAGCPPGRLPTEASATLTAFRRGTLEKWLAVLPKTA
jgi:hypothetical protein